MKKFRNSKFILKDGVLWLDLYSGHKHIKCMKIEENYK